ncbi:hypothetical protein ACWERJ_21140, partial [Streptomyces sp. NPDC004050]
QQHLHVREGRPVEGLLRAAEGLVLRAVAGVGDRPVELRAAADGDGWTCEVPFHLTAVAAAGRRRGRRGMQAWSVQVGVDCADGSSLLTSPRPLDALLRRRALLSSRYGVLLAQPFRTAGGSLALRLAPGAAGALSLVRSRLHRARAGRAAG